jgi:hypothetical protein
MIFQYHKISEFCFPGGIKKKSVPLHESNFSEILYGQKYLHDSSNSYCFVLTGGEAGTLYGICVLIEDLLVIKKFCHSNKVRISNGDDHY